MSLSAASRRHLRAVAEQAVDPRTGIVHYLQPQSLAAGSPPLFHFTAQPSNLGACGWQSNFARMDAASASRELAALGALTEALRFYAAGFYNRQELELFSCDHARVRCTEPGRFALFTAEQHGRPGFPYVPFTRVTTVRWVAATDLCDGEPCYVPAALALVPYRVPPEDGEAAIAPASATGLACAASRDEAICAAVSSAVRDDAAALLWHARLALPQIRIETLSDANYELVERFEATAGRVTAFHATLDLGVPAIVACLRGDAPGAPALVFGAGADPDPEAAMRAALEELALVLRYCQEIQTVLPASGSTADWQGVADQVDHLGFGWNPQNVRQVEPLFGSSQRVDFQSLPNLWTGDDAGTRRRLVDRLKESGYRVLIADLTPPDLRDLGLAVMRAVIPGLQPLFIGRHQQALGGLRLRDVPQILGFPGDGAGLSVPHPFLARGVA